MNDYITIMNDNNKLSISNILSSWYLEDIYDMDSYLGGYVSNFVLTRFYYDGIRENLAQPYYFALFPNEKESIFVVSNPSNNPVYVTSGYKSIWKQITYEKFTETSTFKYLGGGLIYQIFGDVNVVKNLKILKFSPTKNITSSANFGLKIYDEKSQFVFSSETPILKVIASRLVRYSETPRAFNYGYDDVQEGIYNSGNYYNYSNDNKTLGFFADLSCGTTTYDDTSYWYSVRATMAKLTKHTIQTGVYEYRYNRAIDLKACDMDGNDIGFEYGYQTASCSNSAECNTFSVYDVTNYY